MKKILLSAALVASLIVNQAMAQCAMLPAPLNVRVAESQLIVEGKVLAHRSYWNEGHTLILTSYIIDIYKVFKGNPFSSQVEVIVTGGTVGDESLIVIPSPSINDNTTGIFNLKHKQLSSGRMAASQNEAYELTENAQGLISYNLTNGEARDPFFTYNNFSTELYPLISQISGEKMRTLKELPVLANIISKNGTPSVLATISGFSPSIISGGTFQKLTINGSGFGTTTGTVQFKDANSGGAWQITAPAYSILSWTDTKIEMTVPSEYTGSAQVGAGTGPITVTPAGGSAVTSSNSLIVNYSIGNSASGGVDYQYELIAPTSAGTFTWTYNTNFYANINAVNAVNSAMNSWKSTGGPAPNWITSATTSSASSPAYDGINVIAFDNNYVLDSHVLAQTYIFTSGNCLTGEKSTYISQMDIIINDTPPSPYTWYYGANSTVPSNQVDFETNALHELGHSLTLMHVIDATDPMYYTLYSGVSRRTLTCGDQFGWSAAEAIATSSKGCFSYNPWKPTNFDVTPKYLSNGTNCGFTLSATNPAGLPASDFVWKSQVYGSSTYTYLGTGSSINLLGPGTTTYYEVDSPTGWASRGKGCGLNQGDKAMVSPNGWVCGGGGGGARSMNENTNGFDLKVYPNPASETIIITGSTNNALDAKLYILDLLGRTVYSAPLTPNQDGQFEYKMNVQDFKKGIYLIKVETSDAVKTQKLTVE